MALSAKELKIRSIIFALAVLCAVYYVPIMAVSVYNAIHPDNPLTWASSIGAWQYNPHSETSFSVQVMFVLVPRILMQFITWLTMWQFYSTLFFFKEEPELDLKKLQLDESEYPTVDVLLPRYKEPWFMYQPVVEAALKLDYPMNKLNVYICDDGGRLPEHSLLLTITEQRLLEHHPNLHYVKRENGANAKSGNLNNALQQCNGDLVVVFDADHQCFPQFLRETIPHLMDLQSLKLSDNVAMIQTPQSFFNENDLLVKLMDGAQNMFYKLMLPAANGVGVSSCCGTGYVMQRKALNDIGLYPYGFAVEDVFTSLLFFQHGWSAKYKDKVLVKGFNPGSLTELYQQRLRWTFGNAQITFYANLFARNKMTWFQKWIIFSQNWFWIPATLFLFTIVLLFTSSIVYGVVYGYAEASSSLYFLYYSSVPFLFFMFLPVLSLKDKFISMCGYFSLMPVYVSVFYKCMIGHLHRDSTKAKIKWASDAFGGSFPALGFFGIFFCLVFFVLGILGTVKVLSGDGKAAVLEELVFIWFQVGFYISVHMGVWVELYRTVFKSQSESSDTLATAKKMLEKSHDAVITIQEQMELKQDSSSDNTAGSSQGSSDNLAGNVSKLELVELAIQPIIRETPKRTSEEAFFRPSALSPNKIRADPMSPDKFKGKPMPMSPDKIKFQ